LWIITETAPAGRVKTADAHSAQAQPFSSFFITNHPLSVKDNPGSHGGKNRSGKEFLVVLGKARWYNRFYAEFKALGD
jgi:hypothetical protein